MEPDSFTPASFPMAPIAFTSELSSTEPSDAASPRDSPPQQRPIIPAVSAIAALAPTRKSRNQRHSLVAICTGFTFFGEFESATEPGRCKRVWHRQASDYTGDGGRISIKTALREIWFGPRPRAYASPTCAAGRSAPGLECRSFVGHLRSMPLVTVYTSVEPPADEKLDRF